MPARKLRSLIAGAGCAGLGVSAVLLFGGAGPVAATADRHDASARQASGAKAVAGQPVDAGAVQRATARSTAVAADAYPYDPPLLGYLAIDPMAMSPDGNASASNYYKSVFTGLTSESSSACFTTGVNVPNGSLLSSVRAFTSSDSTADNDLFIRLMRRDTLNGDATTLATGYVASDSRAQVGATFAVSPSSAGRVYNTRYTYGLAICLGKGTYFTGAQVRYRYGNAGD